jgi:hypothetical protein
MSEQIIEIYSGTSMDMNLINLCTSKMIIDKYGTPDSIIDHAGFSTELLYEHKGLGFVYKNSDSFEMIFAMAFYPNNNCASTETGLIINENLTLQDVIEDYGVGRTTAGSDGNACIRYEGIIFYGKESDFTQKRPSEVKIDKILILEG